MGGRMKNKLELGLLLKTFKNLTTKNITEIKQCPKAGIGRVQTYIDKMWKPCIQLNAKEKRPPQKKWKRLNITKRRGNR